MSEHTNDRYDMSPVQQGEVPQIAEQAMAIYDGRLKAIVEPEHIGEGIAIHVASGDYTVAKNPTLAGHAMNRLHPEGGVTTFRIGLTPEPALAARLFPATSR